jgi:hypothetical protein
MNKSFVFILFTLSSSTLNSLSAQSKVQVYIQYHKAFSTRYRVDSGNANLISRKMPNVAGVGFDAEVYRKRKFALRTGLALQAYFLDETSYGIAGSKPPFPSFSTYPANFLDTYIKGAEYIEKVSVSIPIKLNYQFYKTQKIDASVSVGLLPTFYFPVKNEAIGQSIAFLNPSGASYTVYRVYDILRDFNNKNNALISKPYLEYQFALEGVYKFKKSGGLLLGIKTNIGTTKLETANFTIWPNQPAYRSKGHYTLNRSYIGIYAGYRFGKNLGYTLKPSTKKTTPIRHSIFTKLNYTLTASYNRHFKSKYIIESGSHSFDIKSNPSYQLNLNADYPLKEKLHLRTGINVHINAPVEPLGLDIIGPVPPVVSIQSDNQSEKLKYVEMWSVGIPVKIQYQITKHKNWTLQSSGGILFNIYLPDQVGYGGSIKYLTTSGNFTPAIEAEQVFNKSRLIKGFSSIPQLEWDFDIESVHGLYPKPAFVWGIQAHIGTKNLERKNIVLWGEQTGYKSTGYYEQNRSYIGIYAGIRFGKKKNTK